MVLTDGHCPALYLRLHFRAEVCVCVWVSRVVGGVGLGVHLQVDVNFLRAGLSGVVRLSHPLHQAYALP